MTDQELLRAAITQSGLSARRFAVEVLVRDPRTLFRWLSGSNPLPKTVRAKLLELTTGLPAVIAPGLMLLDVQKIKLAAEEEDWNDKSIKLPSP